MPVYSIARINYFVDPLYEDTRRRLLPYICDDEEYALDVSASTEEIREQLPLSPVPNAPWLTEGAIIYTKICRDMLARHDGFFFHSSSLCIGGEGVLFTARSGTGKSTHTRLWRERFGDRVRMINDDKPLIRLIDGTFCVCGTPWMGKSDIGQNLIVPVKAVVVLTRGVDNKAEAVRPALVFRELLEATLLPRERDNMEKLLELYDGLFRQAKLIRLSCDISQAAVDAAYRAIFEEDIS